MTRPDWDTYFLGIAAAVSARADCERLKVGALIVKDRHIVGAGYNGAPSGEPGCETCPRRSSAVPPGSSYDTGPGACVAVHAEENALLDAGRVAARGATLFTTCPPCQGCSRLIRGAGIARVVCA